jgi:hypothetical protein
MGVTDDAEVADLDDVWLGSHRDLAGDEPQQHRGTSQGGLGQNAPELLGAGGSAPGEGANRDREEWICPAVEQDGGEPGRWSGDPERDEPGERGRGEHQRDRGCRRRWRSGTEHPVGQEAVTANATG